MVWEHRLREILAGGALVAGGTLVAAACHGSSEEGECCNVNPDPCCPVQYCGAPMNAACVCEMARVEAGGSPGYEPPFSYEGGACPPFVQDAGFVDLGEDALVRVDGALEGGP